MLAASGSGRVRVCPETEIPASTHDVDGITIDAGAMPHERLLEKEITMTTSNPLRSRNTINDQPDRRTAVGLAAIYAVLFVGLLLGSGSEIADDASGATVIRDFTTSSTMAQVGGYGLVITAVILVFWGAAVRRLLSAGAWTADVVLAGTVAMAVALVGWTVTLFALHAAVESGNADAAQTINILDNANFVPAMLGLACIMVGAGMTALREGSLPRWLAIASIVLGSIAPLGPGGFAPFALLPIWIIVVSCLARLPDSR